MLTFKNDCETLIENGLLAPNKGKIRFIFRNNDKLKGGIDKLDLNQRAYHCLMKSGIDTIEKVGDNWDSLNRVRNSGVKTIKEIKNKYIVYYYDTLNNEEKQQFWADTIKATVEM